MVKGSCELHLTTASSSSSIVVARLADHALHLIGVDGNTSSSVVAVAIVKVGDHGRVHHAVLGRRKVEGLLLRERVLHPITLALLLLLLRVLLLLLLHKHVTRRVGRRVGLRELVALHHGLLEGGRVAQEGLGRSTTKHTRLLLLLLLLVLEHGGRLRRRRSRRRGDEIGQKKRRTEEVREALATAIAVAIASSVAVLEVKRR